MRSDALTMTLLYDYYGELLTEKQRGLFDLYYNQDYSLSEIASAAGISRQGVHDMIKRGNHTLEEYEANGETIRAAVDQWLGGQDKMSTRLWWDCNPRIR